MSRYDFKIFNSLRGRYFLAMLSLAIIMLTSAWLIENYVRQASLTGNHNLLQRNLSQPLTRSIRHALREAENALSAYVLSADESQKKIFLQRIDDAITASIKLSEQNWKYITEHIGDIKILTADLIRLREEGKQLMKIRTNIEGLFPAMSLLRDVLTPNNNSFYTAVTLANDLHKPSDSPVYQKISAIRLHWINMITMFRGYITLLTGTFGPDNLFIAQQIKNIDLLYIRVQKLLTELNALPQAELGLQTIEPIMQMKISSKRWHKGYMRLRASYGTQQWRADTPFIQKKIFPLQHKIQQHLNILGTAIEASSVDDIDVLSDVSSSIMSIFWFITIFILSSIIIGYFMLSRNIFQPLASITSALRYESLKETKNPLPQFNTIEARQFVSAFLDMREQIQSHQQALEHQALHDSLTGLPNRSLLQDRIQQAITRARREKSTCAVMIMDLNRFKEINDTLGHHFGDAILKQVGERLTTVLRSDDTIARLGGDEFSIVLPGSDGKHAIYVVEKIMGELEKVFVVDDHNIYVHASLGIAIFPEHGDDSTSLIKKADIAMYFAKQSNRYYALYDNQQDPNILNRLTLINDFRDAIYHNQLELHYQPKYLICTGKLIGAEALLRWNHPVHGATSPLENISLAEQAGLIKPLTLWVLDAALQQYTLWDKAEMPFRLSINLSTSNLQDSTIEKHIKTILEKHQIDPAVLQLEVTENAIMTDPIQAKLALTELDSLGINISVDDFGTGYSSLSLLKQLPVKELKIDKSFVMAMLSDDDDSTIVRSTINLAHNLGMNVVAEGVECQDTLDALGELGCDMAQGFHLGRPLPADRFQDLIRSNAT